MMINKFRGRYAFLSNFFDHPVEFEGITYPSSEHAFQAAKTFEAHEREGIRNAFTPGMAKKIGRRIKLRDDWNEIKNDVMYTIVKRKFSHPRMKQMLLDTEDEELIEGNTWGDMYWGVDAITGVGSNHLGKILMRVRDEIKT
jgi:ribA/ribD-fused uncharacterized protein